MAHVYAIHNTYTGLIRMYAAYDISNPALYSLALWTYVGVLLLYGTETLVWRTVRPREAVIPLVTAGVGITWMIKQRDWYLGL
jgi:carbon starvation protein CstA